LAVVAELGVFDCERAMSDAKPSESRVRLWLRTFCALPMFLVLTVIFWELVLGVWLLSGWFYARGWSGLGLAAQIVWITLAALTVAATVMIFVTWVIQLVRVCRGQD
jgi:hypothetical protein